MDDPDPTGEGGDGSTSTHPDGAADGRPTWSERTRWLVLVGVAAGWLALDQLTKSWAVSTLDTRTIDLVWTLRLRLTYNRGASFSIGDGGSWGPVIGVGAIVVVVVLLWHARSLQTRLGTVALGLVLGGALGNLADRAFRGDLGFLHNPVVDFIDVQWWPVFNLADAGVVVGGILLAFVALFPRDG